ncbi:MAG: hypothetical protein AAGA73_13660 [Pseudomonadota bacterium]
MKAISDTELAGWVEIDQSATPAPWGHSVMPIAGRIFLYDKDGKSFTLIVSDALFVDPKDALP